ncbi:hypothetical protein CAP43_07310 [Acinetobacter junii]|nr:hypothetical protein [Acinetobacter junii]
MHSTCVKKTLYSLIALSMLAFQCRILYGLESELPLFWESFGIEQSPWSKSVTDSLRYWWFGIKIEVILWLYTLMNFRIKTIILTLIPSLLVIFALLWAIYDPTMINNFRNLNS